jgi:hypothetical protein
MHPSARHREINKRFPKQFFRQDEFSPDAENDGEVIPRDSGFRMVGAEGTFAEGNPAAKPFGCGYFGTTIQSAGYSRF